MALAHDPSDTRARRLGRYELLGELASGGMGVVYLGRAHGAAGFERLVAVKLCHKRLQDDPRFVAMFLDEARLAARVHHPNVVATFDAGSEPELHLVMEYVDGFSLAELSAAARSRGEHVPVEISLRILSDALAGLHAVHEARDGRGQPLGLVHRDVSPQNVLVGLDGVARIVDFGVAKAEVRAVTTDEGQVKGKLAYMAPEQLRGDSVTRWTDVYAAGVVLWELLAGDRLFTDSDLRARIDGAPIAPPSRTADAVTPALDAVALRALGNRPEMRFATAAAFADALDARQPHAVSARDVAAYVRDVLDARIEARHAAVARMLTGADVPATAAHEPALLTSATAATVVEARRDSEPGGASPASGRRAWYAPWLAAAAVTAVVLGGVALNARARHAGPDAPPAARAVAAPAPRAAAGPPPTPAALVAPAAPAASAAPATRPLAPSRGTHVHHAARPHAHPAGHYDPPRI